jgi:tetratricopeptide (TPR) repeat protein
MKVNISIILVIAILVSFCTGFLVANSFNRKEMTQLETELANLKNEVKDNPQQTLSNEEIRKKITEADSNPQNLEFQKSLGMALYQYANLKNDVALLDDVSRLLTRANSIENSDLELIATLGNLNFDMAVAKGDNKSFSESRKFYEKALKIKPDNVEIRTNLASSYLLQSPSEVEKAIEEFKKTLEINQEFETALAGIIQAFIMQNNTSEADKYLGKLKSLNSGNASISDFEKQISELKKQ